MNKFEKEANVVLSMKELTGDDKWSMSKYMQNLRRSKQRIGLSGARERG